MSQEAVVEDKVEEFVNDFVHAYLGREVDFMDVVEAADDEEADLTEEELQDAHTRVNALILKIRDHIFK